jgi:hypothetical protein
MTLSFSEKRALALRWIDAWNAHDLDRILDHYAPDVEFEADTVIRRWQRPDGKLRGHAELREHFGRGLEIAPNLQFHVEEVFSSPGGYAVLYTRENGNRVLDCVELNDSGKARRVIACYLAEQK